MRTRALTWMVLGLLVMAFGPAWAAEKPKQPSALQVGVVTAAPGAHVIVPILVLDRARTPLGVEQPVGNQVQAIALRVRCLPAGAVASLEVRPAGALAGLPSLFEARPRATDGASLVVSYDAARAPLPIGPKGIGKRQVIAQIDLRLSAAVARGTTIELRLDPEVTALSNQGGTLSETAPNGWLRLLDGRIDVR